MEQFIMGAIAMASAIVALFFVRFWRETGDRLFAIFALAFLLMGITRVGLATSRDAMAHEAASQQNVGREAAKDANPAAVAGNDASAETATDREPPEEAQTHWYWVRLAAFLLILVAIIDKNRR